MQSPTPNDGKKIKVTIDRDKQQLQLDKQGFKIALADFSLETEDDRRVRVSFVPIKQVGATDPPKGNWALDFNGRGSYVKTPLKYEGNGPFTCEAWLVCRGDVRSETIVAQAGPPHFHLFIDSDNGFRVAANQSRANFTDGAATVRALTDQPIHIAAVYDGVDATVFVNGEKTSEATERISGEVRSRNRGYPVSNSIILGWLGGDFRQKPFDGIIREVRISNSARYTKDFAPAKRFENDAHTLALYYFDEGSGTSLRDSSGNGHSGKIVGAKWVRVDNELRVIDEGQSPRPADSYARDRVAAEWVLSHGGTVMVSPVSERDKKSLIVTDKQNLPTDAFVLDLVNLFGVSPSQLNGLEMLRGLAGLESLTLSESKSADMPRLPLLHTASINGGPIQTSQLRSLARQPSLDVLSLNGSQVNDQWQFLEALPQLRQIFLQKTDVVPALEQLCQHHQIRELWLEREGTGEWEQQIIETVQEHHPSLRVLVKSATGLRVLGQDPLAKKIERLEQAGVKVKCADLAGQPWFPGSDVDLGHISEMTIPAELDLSPDLTRLVGECMKASPYTHLKASGRRQADALIFELSKYNSFDAVKLLNSDLSDVGLSVLQKFPSLRILHVSGTKVTRSGIEELKRHAPNANVSSDFGVFVPEHKLPAGWEVPAETPAAYVWPKDQPAPAIAPFTAEEAKQHQQAWAKYLNVPVVRDIKLPNGEQISLVLIPPGEFYFGSTEEVAKKFEAVANNSWIKEAIEWERPRIRKRLLEPFYMGKYEVSQSQWSAYQADDPSEFHGNPSHPVEHVSWNAIQGFLKKVNAGLDDEELEFGLPTEVHWEYACRAGSESIWFFGDDENRLSEFAWHRGNSEGHTHPIGHKNPNPFGLHDVYGNAREWCADYCRSRQHELTNPTLSAKDRDAGVRGGHFKENANICRSALRSPMFASDDKMPFGFRVAARLKKYASHRESPAEKPRDSTKAELSKDEREMLRSILRGIVLAEVSKAGIIADMRRFLNDPTEEVWSNIHATAKKNDDSLRIAIQKLDSLESDFVVDELDSYRDLRLDLDKKSRIYQSLLRLSYEAATKDSATVTTFTKAYETLITRIRKHESAIQQYLKKE